MFLLLSVHLLLQMLYRKNASEIVCIILFTYTHSFFFLYNELNVAWRPNFAEFCPHQCKLEQDCLSV